ncbi:MAG: hypothetical protein LAN62_07700 [Acidobacteriia bacterium]|nr:hypothetical protein [Terriglobia bacterium]
MRKRWRLRDTASNYDTGRNRQMRTADLNNAGPRYRLQEPTTRRALVVATPALHLATVSIVVHRNPR